MRDLPDLVAANEPAVTLPRREPLTIEAEHYRALLIARASLEDILKHGLGTGQRRTIENVDLPSIKAAIERIQIEGIWGPKE